MGNLFSRPHEDKESLGIAELFIVKQKVSTFRHSYLKTSALPSVDIRP